jgi:hypothetical protein
MRQFILRQTGHFTRFAVLWITLLATVCAFADTSKISPDPQTLLQNPSASVNVIVQYITLLNAVSATVTTGDVVNLSNQSNVPYISLDRPLTATMRLPPSMRRTRGATFWTAAE